jgi:hypothetical protein
VEVDDARVALDADGLRLVDDGAMHRVRVWMG